MINYNRLGRSVDFYSVNNYIRIESPWTVTSDISDITRPANKTNWEITNKNKVLVASGEQSFLYLYNKGFLPIGRFQTITPCFRDEPFGKFHTKYFIKNELIITDNTSESSLYELVETCKVFFEKELQVPIDIIKTDEGFDLNYANYELGSYGIRTCEFLTWIYGTGCAEPRMSMIEYITKNGIS